MRSSERPGVWDRGLHLVAVDGYAPRCIAHARLLQPSGPMVRGLRVRDMLIGYAWSVDCGMEFLGRLKRVIGSRGEPGGLSDESTGLLLDKNGLYEYESALVPTRIEGDCWAIGSGAQAALGAMYMGATPEEAAEVACAIDPFCGGPVTVERL